jgi:hypothetical protein
VDPIWIVDVETSKNEITEIGIAMLIDGPEGSVLCAKPDQHYLIKIGEPYHTLKEATFILEAMGCGKGLWASYGHNDARILRQEFGNLSQPFPFRGRYLDIAPLYMAFQSDDMLPRKLKEATEDLCGRSLGAQHHADDDAYNAGRLLAAMMNRYNLKEVT